MSRYIELLEQYDKEISCSGWEGRNVPLVIEMDKLWERMNKGEREKCLECSFLLYQARVGGEL